MALESWEFQDPEIVAIRREETRMAAHKACGLCKYRVSMTWRGQSMDSCLLRKQTYGIRCINFQTRKATHD